MPMGLLDQVSAASPSSGLWTDFGPMLPLTQYTEQLPLFNAMNFMVNVYDWQNTTINAVGMSTLWCPSDPGVEQPQMESYVFLSFSPPLPMRYSSYAGCAGAWLNYQFGQAPTRQTGVLYAYSCTKMASITDGTSNTILFGEHTRSIENATDQICWHWWTSGNYGDTIFSTFFPINPQKKLPYGCADNTGPSNVVVSASSMHPGGANIAMCDGSVRFVKETISSWQNTSTSPGTPAGMSITTLSDGTWVWTPTPTTAGQTILGVWQQLATRNGGEVLSSDQY